MTTINNLGLSHKATANPFAAATCNSTLRRIALSAMLALSATAISMPTQAGNTGQAYAQYTTTATNSAANLSRFTRRGLDYNTQEAELIASVESKADEISNAWIESDNATFIGAADTYKKLKTLYPDVPAVFLYEHMLILEEINSKNNATNDDLNNLKISLIALQQEFDKMYVGANYNKMTDSAREKVTDAVGYRGSSVDELSVVADELYRVTSNNIDSSIRAIEQNMTEAEAARQRAEQNMIEAEASRKRTQYYRDLLKQYGVE